MSTLITSSFFIKDINLPNRDAVDVKKRIDAFINELEETCLSKTIGYPTFEFFDDRYNLLFSNNVVGNNDVRIKVGYTVGLVAELSTVTFDGTNGKPDYRGSKLILTDVTAGFVMTHGTDYLWNETTGLLSLLDSFFIVGNVYNIHLEAVTFVYPDYTLLNSVSVKLALWILYGKVYTDSYSRKSFWAGLITMNNTSLIAYYVYYFIQEDNAKQTRATGVAIKKGDLSIPANPADKMINAWNKYSEFAQDLLSFLMYSTDVDGVRYYDMFTSTHLGICLNHSRRNNIFGL